MKKVSTLTALFCGLSLCLPHMGATADTLEVNFQSMYAGPHVLNTQLYQPGSAAMEKLTNGELKLHYFMSGALTKPEEVVPSMINGNLDMAGIGVHYQDNLFPHSIILEIPHITKDSVHASAFYWKAYNEIPEIKAEVDKVGKVLTVWGSDRSALFSAVGPILSPADLKGKRVLLWSGGQVDQVKAWGGVPVQVSPNDTYMGLQRGMGDVFFGPLPTGVAYKIMEVAKDATIIPATTLFLINSVNHEVWNDMTPASQKAMMDTFGGEEKSKLSGQLLFDGSNRDLETMKAAGVKIHTLTDAQYQSFKDADRDTVQSFWVNDLTRLGIKDPEAWITKIRNMADSMR